MGIAAMQAPNSAPYYFSVPNYANSPFSLLVTSTTFVGNPRIARLPEPTRPRTCS